ncbi:hypothetical protein PAXINDRAFT_88087 [Paxillus involutus ATCC 200175]|uniref:Uncharacterized protein n=1 Tax=Paxillus involutus ATCC 200175 TaxID=664439 RepID=A0A0C9SPI3_PAXIN|nr:hypothetical protein PAXINDRAFT_88087 [Paxillus involutus ATCC 200175]
MANSERRMTNGKWQMANGKWQMANDKWGPVNGEWRKVNGKWQMANIRRCHSPFAVRHSPRLPFAVPQRTVHSEQQMANRKQ